MKIGYADGGEWHKDHPQGTLVFQYLLIGEPDTPENFMFLIARQDADFQMPRHRHNFDQIRYPLTGDMNIGQGVILKQGQVGYFPEGLPYGPQEDPLGSAKPGERLQLVLQFGGASGAGFMSMAQRQKAWKELAEVGRFEGPHYHRPDGRVQWGLNAVWEHVFGEKLSYPKPRYDSIVIADPNRFNWLPVPGADGVHRRYLGSFSERQVSTEFVRIAAGKSWTSTDDTARRLMFVDRGAGRANGEPITPRAAIQIEAGEQVALDADDELHLFVIGLPPVTVPETPDGEFEVVDGFL